MTDPQVNAVNSLFFLFLSTVWCDGLGPNLSKQHHDCAPVYLAEVRAHLIGSENASHVAQPQFLRVSAIMIE
jgi:hypothetical protein